MLLIEADEEVDVRNMKHIAEYDIMVGDRVERITEEWNAQKQLFYQQTGMTQQIPREDKRTGTAISATR